MPGSADSGGTDEEGRLSLYLLPRTALVLKRVGSAVMARPAEPDA